MAFDAPYLGTGVPEGAWSTGLLSCHQDKESALMGLFCPCVLIGQNSEIVSDGFSDPCDVGIMWCFIQTFTCLGFLATRDLRTRLREKYVLPVLPYDDTWTHLLCWRCAVCQEYRELKNRGWDPKLGYAANVIKFRASSALTAPPAVEKFEK